MLIGWPTYFFASPLEICWLCGPWSTGDVAGAGAAGGAAGGGAGRLRAGAAAARPAALAFSAAIGVGRGSGCVARRERRAVGDAPAPA